MADKFIPEGDPEFANMARNFASGIARDPGRFHLSADDSQIIMQAVTEFRDALSVALHKYRRTTQAVRIKNEARAKAVRIIRKYANQIRANTEISQIDKGILRVRVRPSRSRSRKCPQTRPLLMYKGASGEGGFTGRKHRLLFLEELGSGTSAKPAGAVRVELFMGLVAEGEGIPKHPDDLCEGRVRYLRSFSRNPIEVEFPMPRSSMLVVYWARWANTTGEVGPLSKTCVATVEGWASGGRALPDQTEARRRQQKIVITSAMKKLPNYGHEGGHAIEDVGAGVGRLLPAATE